MENILIIDDNQEQSETVQANILLELERLDVKDINVLCLFPFEELSMYMDYINNNDVCAIILDEKLNDQPNSDGKNVDYMGHNLVKLLREFDKDIPIYTITNFSNEPDLQNVYSEFEQVISRKDFYSTPEKYVPIIVRASRKFVDRYNKTLSEFSQLSQQIALGNATPDKIERLQAIQVSMELPILGFDDRSAWLNEYEEQLKSLKALRDELKRKLSDL